MKSLIATLLFCFNFSAFACPLGTDLNCTGKHGACVCLRTSVQGMGCGTSVDDAKVDATLSAQAQCKSHVTLISEWYIPLPKYSGCEAPRSIGASANFECL